MIISIYERSSLPFSFTYLGIHLNNTHLFIFCYYLHVLIDVPSGPAGISVTHVQNNIPIIVAVDWISEPSSTQYHLYLLRIII